MSGEPSVAGSDFGRRVLARREELGLSREETAERTGSSVGYIRYIEEFPSDPETGFVVRLADALQTTAAELVGATYQFPPGVARAGRGTQLVVLGETESRAHLGDHGIGRLASYTEQGPIVLPVNYTVTKEGDLAFRTARGSAVSKTAGTEIAFEVDHIDDVMAKGWSVLVVGMVRAVTDSQEAEKLDGLAHGAPWAGEDRNTWLVLKPGRITGRRIQSKDSGG